MISEPGMLRESRGKHKKQHKGKKSTLSPITCWHNISNGAQGVCTTVTNQQVLPIVRCVGFYYFCTLYKNRSTHFLGYFCNSRSFRPPFGARKQYRYPILQESRICRCQLKLCRKCRFCTKTTQVVCSICT